MTKQQIKPTAWLSCSGSKPVIISVLIAALTALGAAFGLTSCNVTRTITTKSEYSQRGDTTIIIQSKTIESYDASKKLY